MKPRFLFLSVFLLASCGLTPASSSAEESSLIESSISSSIPEYPSSIQNGGFETADLTGWEIVSGNAYDDDSVSSSSFFRFSYDEEAQEISRNKAGNWYLDGRGFDLSRRGDRKGILRSSTFILGEGGDISFRLAGGAPTKGRGSTERKPDSSICYLGVYDAESDELIAKQRNDYFVEQNDTYVDAKKYELGAYSTDNFNSYTVTLLDYVNKPLYIQIVDCDDSIYYGYFSVDDIRISGEASQPEGPSYTKTKPFVEDVEAPSAYQIKNGGFETGNLAGWEILEGDAFSDEGVNAEASWWNENITYSRDGNYHYGFYNPSGTGRMKSSSFVLGGCGIITFKLGGCKWNDRTYLSLFMEEEGGDVEIARFSNDRYWDFQFPYVENGMRLLNMNLYVADMSLYLGQTLHFEVVDEASANDDLGCITLDSIETYYEEKPTFYDVQYFTAKSIVPFEVYPASVYSPRNGGFETGDTEGWTLDGDFGVVKKTSVWWGVYAYNELGAHLFTGEDLESGQGTLTSSPFVVGGSGYITFRLGGAKNPRLVYVSLVEEESGEEIARYGNPYFHDLGTGAINHGSNLFNMIPYVIDAREWMGKTLRFVLHDHASNDWGLLAFDGLCTYHPTAASIPDNSYSAENLLGNETKEGDILNGNFETGDLTGWTKEGNIGDVEYESMFWNEGYSYEKEGNYFFSGWRGAESAKGTLTSSPFTVGEETKLTFRLGGAKNSDLTYVSLVDGESGEELERYSNYLFNDAMRYTYQAPEFGKENILSKDGAYLANLVPFVADLSAYQGRTLRIRLVDNAEADWGLFFADDFHLTTSSLEELLNGCYPAKAA